MWCTAALIFLPNGNLPPKSASYITKSYGWWCSCTDSYCLFWTEIFFLLPVFHSLICRLYFPWRLSHSPSDVDELWYSMLSHIHSGFLSARWRPYLHSHHTKCLQVGGILLVIPVSVKAVVCRTVETRRASIENSHLNINPTCSFQATLTTLQRSLARCVSGSSATFNRLS